MFEYIARAEQLKREQTPPVQQDEKAPDITPKQSETWGKPAQPAKLDKPDNTKKPDKPEKHGQGPEVSVQHFKSSNPIIIGETAKILTQNDRHDLRIDWVLLTTCAKFYVKLEILFSLEIRIDHHDQTTGAGLLDFLLSGLY